MNMKRRNHLPIKFFYKKKRFNLGNDEKKKQYLKKESVKFTQRKKFIKHEKKRSYENVISEMRKKIWKIKLVN